MDQRKLITIIKQFPQLWERNHPKFRDKDEKDRAWEVIGSKMECAGEICKETFKSIREKYVREREKAVQTGKGYREWDLLPELTFLDPNIVPRKQSSHNDDELQKVEEFCSQINLDASFPSITQADFDKALIELVKKTTPIWDRNCNTYPNKQLKNQLWQNIASKLNKDMNQCMLRWKALREKYIRQKMKFQQEGDFKWELLDEMKFLDKVIQYRKKQSDNADYKRMRQNENSNFSPIDQRNDYSQESTSSFQQNMYNYESGNDTLLNDSSNDYHIVVKQEDPILQKADSSYNAEYSGSSRKRSLSINSEASVEKISKNEEPIEAREKSPEQLFGDLVAVMLSKKPEKYRNIYMIEIMQVLSK